MTSPTPGGAQTHPERVMAFRSFPDVVHQLMAKFSIDQEMHWLQTGLDDGHFDFAKALHQEDLTQAIKNIDSSLAFLQTVGYESTPLGSEEKPSLFLAFTVHNPDLFLPYFEAFVDRLVNQYHQAFNPDLTQVQLHQVMGRVLVAAIAVDSLSCVDKLVKANRNWVNQRHSPFVMGVTSDALKEAIVEPDRSVFTPYFFALQLGREDCMRTLVAAGARLDDLGRLGLKTIDLLDTSQFAPTCRLPAYRLALEQWREEAIQSHPSDEVERRLHEAAIGMLSYSHARGPTHRKKHYIECFEQMGCYEINPQHSFVTACNFGRPDIAERIQGKIDWSPLRARPENGVQESAGPLSFVFKALKAPVGDEDPERMGLMLMKKSLEDGVFDQVFAPVAERGLQSALGVAGKPRAQPVSHMIEVEGLAMLTAWMKQGMDPTKPQVNDSLSPVDYAESIGKEAVAHALRTFVSRKKVLSLLDDMESPQKEPSP